MLLFVSQVSSPDMEVGEATEKKEAENESSPLLTLGLVTASSRDRLLVPLDANGNDLEV